MSRVTTELDFFGLEKKQTNNVPNPKFKKFLDRRRSFRGSFYFSFLFIFCHEPFYRFLFGIIIFITDIQGAISKINPEIIKSLLASGANHADSSTISPSIPSAPKADHPLIPISPVQAPLTMLVSFIIIFAILAQPVSKQNNIIKF